jgi:hypothetical protein
MFLGHDKVATSKKLFLYPYEALSPHMRPNKNKKSVLQKIHQSWREAYLIHCKYGNDVELTSIDFYLLKNT